MPVIYDPRVSGGIIRHFASGINGSSISRGTSFLGRVHGRGMFFRMALAIIDDPHRNRGLWSKPSMPKVCRMPKVSQEDGVLKTWVMDLASSRQFGLSSTEMRLGNRLPPPCPAGRITYGSDKSPAELMSDISSGFYVTELIGMGINMVTGDYSRGATGFWIEMRQLTR